ncbi:MAG: DUF4431 domain-containing protein [Chlamydiae bacterium]|nr:DUF4431 domain-containing protein [Chlamydiota bacterium]
MKKNYWQIFLILHVQSIFAFALSSDIITDSIEYPSDQSKMKICLEGTYDKIQVPYRTRYPNGVEVTNLKSIIIFKPLDKLIGTSALSIGNKFIDQNQKTIPFFLIGKFPCYDEFAFLLGKKVYIEGSLEKSNDLFFFNIPQIHLDYVVDVKWKSEPCETLFYESKEVILEGSIYQVTYPGPSEYMSIENGDNPETSWILALKKPIHVSKTKEIVEDDINYPEKYVLEVVVIPPESLTYSVMNKKVRVKGSLFHSHTAHHSRRILCDAKSIDIIE